MFESRSLPLHQTHGGRGGAPLEEELILAKDLMSTVLRHQVEVVEEFSGSNLVGMSYQPLFEGAIDGSIIPLLGLS